MMKALDRWLFRFIALFILIIVSDFAYGAFSGNGPFLVHGLVASGNSVSGVNPLLNGCRAQNAEPTLVSNGQLIAADCGLSGEQIFLPYANKENYIRGTGSSNTTSPVTIINAQGSGIKIYVTAMQCGNSSTSTDFVTLNDSASTPLINPGGGGNNPTFPTPLVVAANTALTFAAGTAVATQVCTAQGYAGS
jgi:hypothetical protein